MTTEIHKSESRGHANHGWLNARHSFSFARYYNPERMNFGALRVLNDDIIKPAAGFGRHPHDNMEIITIPVKGGVLHRDSMGHEEVIDENEVQVMSAGTGIFHEEWNASNEAPVNLLQLWIMPEKKNIKPQYKQSKFSEEEASNVWQYLVNNKNEKGELNINAKAHISRTFLSEGKTLKYELSEGSFGAYLFIVEGKAEIDGFAIENRDAIGITNTKSFNVKALTDIYLINVEVPELSA